MSDYADKIASSTPLPATWALDVDMSEALMAQIVAFGATCAREGYALGFGAHE